SSPTVTPDSASVTGTLFGSVSEFLGIPFAQPPFSATAYCPACPQQAMDLPTVSGLPAETLDYLTNTIYNVATPSEKPLTLNVVTPADATPDPKLPVVAWIYGGGFDGTSQYDDSMIVEKAISLGVPANYVRMNYR
ncbi:hypothetical protein PAXINDRAFT_82077, partial [Paxillus involutus ATCC 200175]